jgi:hypothetical protein
MRLSVRVRFLRLLIGLVIVAVILGSVFVMLPPWIHTWEATAREAAWVYHGDELLSNPVIEWTHGVTIEASPEQVWPWLAQIGERRGGFYSYTFIENMIAGEQLYVNADRIIPELQSPQPGDVLIGGMLKVREVNPQQWLLAESSTELGWTWLWQLQASGMDQTRLLVRMRIEPSPGEENPIMTWLLDAGGFVMERRMLWGLKARAEGRTEPAYLETVEIVVWVLALLEGLAAALLFLFRKEWGAPLALGVAAIVTLLAFTFLQPAIWVRVLVDVGLLAGLVVTVRNTSPGRRP